MTKELTFGGSPRWITGVAGITLAAVGWIVYFSPLAPTQTATPATKIRVVTTMMPRQSPVATTAGAHATPTAKHVTVTSVKVERPPVIVNGKVVAYPVIKYVYLHRNGKIVAVPAGSSTSPGSTTPATCSSFHWQQDAQGAYKADLSDPNGLDGPIGPNNGDGLACGSLPSDPSRASSKPIGAFTFSDPVIPTRAHVLASGQKYLGLAADGLPGDSGLFDREAAQTGVAPSAVEWFQNFGDAYPYAKVNAAWTRGALPVVTWMSAPAGFSTASDLSAYSLKNIAKGSQDAYIKSWASSIAIDHKPVVIRFDHESNGDWYPWSVGWNKQGITGNTPAVYRAAWRHVWNIFQAYGANSYAIWAYVPSRIDTLGTYGTGKTQTQLLAQSYPGAKYVSWVGMDGYQYDVSESSTYSQTFGNTLAALKSFSSKPILVAEMGASDDPESVKTTWISQTLAGLAADPRIVGAIYFDNDVSGVHYINGLPVRTDWKLNTSSASLDAFSNGAHAGGYATGIYPGYMNGP